MDPTRVPACLDFAEIGRMLQIDPGGPVLGSHGGWIEAAYGYPEKARRITEEKLGQITTSITVIAVRAFAFARPGHEPAARALLDILSDSSRVAAPDNALISTAWVRAMTAAGAPCEPED